MDALVLQERVITVENSEHGYTSEGQLIQTFGKHAEFPPTIICLFARRNLSTYPGCSKI